MFYRRIVSALILGACLSGMVTPLPSYAQGNISSVQAKVDSMGSGAPAGRGDAFNSGTGGSPYGSE